MLHTFRKDLRRLWWAAGLSLVLLGILARQDRWRSDRIAGSMEGWLNVIVPFAWACLLGLAVEQDPLVGDRQFWITRPHRRASLLAAKLLFAAVFIHAPSLIADCYILASRGFSPLQWLPQLFWKQAMLAAALTLPSLALAALFRNFTQFMLAALCAVAAIVILSGTYQARLFVRPADQPRMNVVVLVVCLGAAAVILLQYLRRKTLGSRAIGLVAGCLAAAAYSWLPTATLWAARSHTGGMSLQVLRGSIEPPFNRTGQPANRVSVFLPLGLSGFPAAQQYRMEELQLEIEAPGGERHLWQRPKPLSGYSTQPDLNTYLQYSREGAGTSWMTVQMSVKLFSHLNQHPVTIRGREGVTLLRPGPAATVPLIGTSPVLGRFRCTGTSFEDPWSQSMVKFECESPGEIPPYTMAELAMPSLLPNWKHQLGDTYRMLPYVNETWLSPLNRQETFFDLTYPVRGNGLLPLTPTAEDLGRRRVTVTPEDIAGYVLVDFEAKDIRLGDFMFSQAAKP